MSISCESGNATPPSPAIAPGAEAIDVRRAAEAAGARGMDPRITALVPGFDAPFFQAGLAGYSDAAMRLIARRHGAPFCVTEALLDRTLLAGGRGFAKADLGELHDNVPGGAEDHPLACQIMGSEPEEMAVSALKVAEQGRRGDKVYRRMAYGDAMSHAVFAEQHLRLPGGEQLGRDAARDDTPEPDAAETAPDLRFEVIDINLACPVKKIKAKARGGHWLAEPAGAIRLLERVRELVPKEIPCTVKLRRSFDDTPEMAANFEKIFDAAYRMGYAWTTVHARTVEQKYIGPSRWTFLRDLVRRYPDCPVMGSGDVWEVGDIFRMIEYTGVSGVSVARGCIGNPWIFRQARELMAGRAATAPTIAEQRGVLDEHFRLLMRVHRGMRHGELFAAKQMRKFGIRFSAHHPRREAVRLKVIAVSSLAEWERVLAEEYSG